MSTQRFNERALDYHQKPRPGKIEVVPTKNYSTQRDLSYAYSPGVAVPSLEIVKDRSTAYKYTNKGNLVAVISNGSAVLGLGNIGPDASKPVMEGKGLLFKIFADIDVFDIEINAENPKDFIETVKRIAPTFGGINLEDIKAPEAFEIEKRLKAELPIPVIHDDQHGTAIISCAALINALEIVEKKIDQVNMVVLGAGAAAISCTNLYCDFGLKKQNVVMVDSKGVIRTDRSHLTPQKKLYATDKNLHTLEQAINGADVLIGLSGPNILTPEMLRSMADNPIVFAMANPNPEIEYPLAIEVRDDVIMATGRSDYPNQVNNVLGFPFLFRGALDVRATAINEPMKRATVQALADLAKEPVPETVNVAYDKTRLHFGREYIIPKPFDPRLITRIPLAVAKAAVESGVATQPIQDWEKYQEDLAYRVGGDSKKTVRLIQDRAKLSPKRIVFAEAEHLEILRAAQIIHEEKIGVPILLGEYRRVASLMQSLDFDFEDVEIINIQSEEQQEKKKSYAQQFWDSKKRRGRTLYNSQILMNEPNYFGSMMVRAGDADAMISGYAQSYPAVIKPILSTAQRPINSRTIAATNLMVTRRGPLFLSDTTINVDPSSEELVKIAEMTAQTVKMFGYQPVMAMLSFSNFGSSPFPQAQKVSEAVKILHQTQPDLIVDGPIQCDFALSNKLLAGGFPFSSLNGKKVNTLIFPNLDAANITYKLMKELNGTLSIGPILMGLNKSIHVLQFRASIQEIVNMAAVAVIDAQWKSSQESCTLF
ncbi:MAG: NADP-dependent malic enzyme [Flavobacteriaceae bacterium]|nr:NADP-dependent malic enzyme [Flavobacteriaceae bacterium]MCY4215862.1 NADP-dependent malic enzyme [Flavobacteriaceae bacterium]MCY4254040.1 NADP-dependent malic enzyme [Flavobacteriaceae bacterium]